MLIRILPVAVMAMAMALSACGSEQSSSDEASSASRDSVSDAETAAPSESALSSKPNLPFPEKIAAACGGEGSKNWRFAIDPKTSRIFLATVVDKSSWSSDKWHQDGQDIVSDLKNELGNITRISFDRADLSLSISTNYQASDDAKADACFARIEAAKRDCADAGDIDQCIDIRYPDVTAKMVSGSCANSASHWTRLSCENLGDEALDGLVSEIAAMK